MRDGLWEITRSPLPIHSEGGTAPSPAALLTGLQLCRETVPAEGESGQERLEREQAAYLFFAANGCREVPRQLAVDPEHHMALFEWLEGGRPAADDISALDAMVGFLSRLHALREEQAAAKLATAKDAVFSLDELVGQLQRRIATFAEVAAEHPPLQHHMQEIVIPAAAALVRWAGDTARAVGIDSSSLLEPRYRTLSPSDVGSHNMLKTLRVTA